MRKIAIIILLFIMSGCGTSQPQATGDVEKFNYELEQDGLTLQATIHVGETIDVKASITNTSGETIIYNERCGIPFRISINMKDTYSHLIPQGENENVFCDELFDPRDLKRMKRDKTFTKETTFMRQVSLDNNRTMDAQSGVYEVSFSFTTYDNGTFFTSFPIELTSDKKSSILTVDEARKKAKANEEVTAWLEKQEQEGLSVQLEKGILNQVMWSIAFHTIHEDGANRIIVNMDAKSGKVVDIHYEQLGRDVVPFMEEW